MSEGPSLLTRTRTFVSSLQFSLLSTAFFACAYTWPFLTMDKPAKVFRFIFVAWAVHIAIIALTGYATRRTEAEAEGDE